MSDKPAYIHHVNFPTTDPERTIEWYTKVFGMKYIKPKSNTKVVLMTRGNFDLHFTPVEEMDRMAPYHFAVEVEDWDGFLEHLDKLGIRHGPRPYRDLRVSWRWLPNIDRKSVV